jgi:hypothetical protein
VAVGMIVRVQTVVNVAQRTKDVVVYQVDSVSAIKYLYLHAITF